MNKEHVAVVQWLPRAVGVALLIHLYNMSIHTIGGKGKIGRAEGVSKGYDVSGEEVQRVRGHLTRHVAHGVAHDPLVPPTDSIFVVRKHAHQSRIATSLFPQTSSRYCRLRAISPYLCVDTMQRTVSARRNYGEITRDTTFAISISH